MTVFSSAYILRINIDDYWTQATYDDADTYFTARGSSTWTGTNAAKTQALQRAWDYMRNLQWTEEAFVNFSEMPDDIKNAHILLALEELTNPGVLTPSLTADNYLESKGIASGAISKVYRHDAPAWKRFRGIDMILAPYLTARSISVVERG